MRLGRDHYFLSLLPMVASRATCSRRKVAAIITNYQGHVLAMGYNGVPSGVAHCIDTPCAGAKDGPGNYDSCLAIHAEQNALLQCTRLPEARVIYCSTTPCFTCAKLICNTPIEHVYCVVRHPRTEGVELLEKCGRVVTFLDEMEDP